MTEYVTVIRNEPSPHHAGWFEVWALRTDGSERCIGQHPKPMKIGERNQL